MNMEDTEILRLPNGHEVRLSPEAAAAYRAVLLEGTLTKEDVGELCKIVSAWRSVSHQLALIERYKTAIGAPVFISWKRLTNEQRLAARREGFAYHPGPAVVAPHNHMGGGAVDLPATLNDRCRAALEKHGWRQNVPTDAVHWAFRPPA